METGSSSGRPGDQTPPSAPRTLLVTSSQLNRCESAVEAHFLLKLLKNKMDYCSLHGIEVFLDAESESDSESARLRVLRRLLVSHPETEWIWWLDSTAMFTNMSHELPYESYAGHNVVMHYEASNGISRSVLIRNSEWALNHLQKVDWNSKPSEEVMVDMEMKVDDFGGSTEEGDGTWPFITDFGSCNMCTKGMDLGCMSRIERAFIYADGQHRHVISG
ncbi:hypothetical protein KP509_18G057700 [Ceratopteris richardii]|nr:hypothetical protein KP509_18G057700 [Ceratopteris richardii]